MALWLELIPKIHRSDELDRSFHLLDDHDNETTFERDGTRRLLADEPVVSGPYLATAATSSSTTSSSTSMSSAVAVRAAVSAAGRTSSTPPPATTSRRSGGGGVTPSEAGSMAVAARLASVNVPLSVTVAVGCSLLLLNVAVFVVVCRQKRRARLKLVGSASRFRSRDQLKHGGGGGVDTESAGFESNRSSLSSNYSLATSSVHHAADCGRCRNVRFCEAAAAAAASRGAPAVATSQDGGSSAFAARRLPARPNDAEDCADADPTTTSNHLGNPSTTV